jgi:hypothetical protein
MMTCCKFLLVVLLLELIIQPSAQVSTKSKSISPAKNLKLSRGTIAKFLYEDISTSSPIIEYHPIDTTISQKSFAPIFTEVEPNTFRYVPSTNPLEYRVIQFYDSNKFKCPDCSYFKEHYVKLALRISEVLQSSQANDIQVSFHAVSCPHYPDLCHQQKAGSNLPIIRLYSAESKHDIDGFDLHHHSVHPFQVIDRLGIRAKLKETTKFLDSHAEYEADWRVGAAIEQKRQHFQHYADQQQEEQVISNRKEIEKTFPKIASELEYDVNKVLDNMLRNYIHTQNLPKPTDDPEDFLYSKQAYLPLSEVNQYHLQTFLSLLRKTLPQAWQPLHRLLQDILDNLTYVANDHTYLVKLIDEHTKENKFVVKKEWSQYCTEVNAQLPSEEDDDDHSCGFWQLLQTISVGMVEWNQIAYDGNERLQPDEIMTALTSFFHSFNSGGFDMISSSTLQYMYSTCAHNACNRLSSHGESDDGSLWIEFPLWMNEMRNYFNVQTIHRVAYNAKRRPSFQEELIVQRPTIKECPRCWTKDQSDTTVTKLSENEMIYRYLKVQYGPQDYPAVLQTLKRQLFASPLKSSDWKEESHKPYHNHFHGERHAAPILQVHSASAIIFVFFGLLFRLITWNEPRSKNIRQLSSRHLFVDKIA